MVTAAGLLEAIRESRLMPIIRSDTPELALLLGRSLISQGMRLLEVSLTTPEAIDVIRELAREADATVGAGTVLRADQVTAVREAGAGFIVTPALAPSLEAAHEAGLPALVGALTPTEIAAAVERGAAAVKLFPAELGGVGYFSALRAPFPDVPLIPVGGVTVDSGAQYLERGAVGLGLGSPLTGGIEGEQDLPLLTERASAFLRLAAGFR